MKFYNNPQTEDWNTLCERPFTNPQDLDAIVTTIFESVKLNGDTAVSQYTLAFDKVLIEKMEVTTEEIQAAITLLDPKLKEAINIAKNNIELFHRSQVVTSSEVTTTVGVTCWRADRAIEKVGIYIPGGSAPLFSTVLMLGVPAQIAGCEEIILCTPPDDKGNINPAILYTAQLVGIKKIMKVGGIQAIAALSLGTASITKVDKIFGPGNQYVTAAKMKSQQLGIAIDMPAGPSEVLVIADKHANPAFVAADLLSQAEHGADSQVILLSDDASIIEAINVEIDQQLSLLSRKDIARAALDNSKAILLPCITDALDFSNQYAPEHLIINTLNPRQWIPFIKNAGSVFLGAYTCESAGDYASGTNHTLPTNGFAKSYSGVSIDSFIKKITFQEISKIGIQNLGPTIQIMAENEYLDAHKNAVTVRLNTIINE